MSFLTVFSQTTLLDTSKFLVFALYDSSAPTVLLEKIAPAKPYGDPLQVTFTYDMQQGHIYRFRLWESPDDTATGLVRNSANVNGSTNSVSIRLPIYAEVDVTPNWTSGSATVADATYVGWTISKLTRNPDYLVFDDAPDNTKNDCTRNTDGFTLTDGTLQPNEQWCVEFAPLIIAAPSGTPSAPFSTGRIITVDTILTNADKNQSLIIRSATDKIKITLPDSATLTDFQDWLYIKSEGGNHINVELAFTSGADSIAYLGGSLTKFYLGQSEDLNIYCFNKTYFVGSNPQGMKLVGSYLYSDNLNVQNYILCAGQPLSRASYPMLWAYVQGLGTAVTEVVWNNNGTIDGLSYFPNRGKFSLGDGSTTFRLPDFTNQVIKSASSGFAGDSEFQMSIDHAHGGNHSGSTTPGGTGALGGSSGTPDAINMLSGGMAATTDGDTFNAVGDEVRVNTRLKYCLIRIG